MLVPCVPILQDSHLVLQTTQSLLSSVLINLSSETFMTVEVALRVFYMLGEVVTDKVGGNFRNFILPRDNVTSLH